MPSMASMEPSNFPESHSWTDDLPICGKSGVGYAMNQVYREDGQRQFGHSFEETFIHCGSKEDETTFLYGVFDGHDGVAAAEFAVQGLAAELLLGQLLGKTKDSEIKEALSQAFTSVEKNYLQCLDDSVAKRTALQFQIDGMSSYEVYQSFPHVLDELKGLNAVLSCSTTAVVALVTGNKLYVANIGDSRALLCRTDAYGVNSVIQLSVDHDLSNEDELLRLGMIGIPGGVSRLGNQETTRCIGNYLVKGAYKEFEELADATEEPVIAEPEIQGGIEIDSTYSFLLLMSDGLYRSLEEATGTTQVNKDIVQMAVAEFRAQSTLTGVAQAVVDKVVRRHTDSYFSGGRQKLTCRDDITLLVRNFNFPLASDLKEQTPSTQPSTLMSDTTSSTLSNQVPPPKEIQPYVDFSEFFANINRARLDGTLPPALDF